MLSSFSKQIARRGRTGFALTPNYAFGSGLDRVVAWGTFYALVLLAWGALFWWVAALPSGWQGQGATALGALGQPLNADFAWFAHGDPAWSTLAGMWALMALAMMMPTLLPYQRTLMDLSARLPAWERAAVRYGFLAAYIGVWAAFGLLAAGLQGAFYAWGWLDAVGVSTLPWLTFGLLTFAGLYQFSALKQACLSACQAPFQFFLAHWRDGALGGVRMGARHGAVCLGCCWALMTLGFVGGTMNLAWMGLATLLMTLEKLPGLGRWISPLIGGGLLALAAAYGVLQWASPSA